MQVVNREKKNSEIMNWRKTQRERVITTKKLRNKTVIETKRKRRKKKEKNLDSFEISERVRIKEYRQKETRAGVERNTVRD